MLGSFCCSNDFCCDGHFVVDATFLEIDLPSFLAECAEGEIELFVLVSLSYFYIFWSVNALCDLVVM